MKKWQVRVEQLLKKLNLTSKIKSKDMTSDDWKSFSSEYKKEHGVTYEEDRAADEDSEDPVLSQEMQQEILDIIAATKTDEDDEEVPEGSEPKPTTQKQAVTALTKTAKKQQKTIQQLANKPEDGTPIAVVGASTEMSARAMAMVMGRTAHTPTHLFGIEDKLFARGNWWTDLTVTRKEVEVDDLNSDQKEAFRTAFKQFASNFRDRAKQLHESNQLSALDFKQMAAGEPIIDYSEVTGKLGEFVTRRTDMVIAYLRSLPTVTNIFPLVSGIQNKATSPGAYFGELSQGHRSGRIFKGSASFTAEIYQVIDLMFKFKFTDMIKLEKQYIGYMNREGSSPIKWTFIEWIMSHFGKILIDEQNRRRVVGVRTPQQDVVANPAMLGADGALRAIERVEEELKVLPFKDMRLYDETTIGEYAETLWDSVEEILPSMEGLKLHINAKHKKWYTRWFREKYGKDNDFTGVKEGLQDVSPETIVWVPNMPMWNCKMWITSPGNIELYEDKPNEMHMFDFEQDFEDITVRSRWKEGSGLLMAGIQYKTLALLTSSGRENQYIFTNYPVSVLAADATKVNGRINSTFETAENTAATAITDIENASIETVYKIVCGNAGANKTTIAKSGKFAKITSAWSPANVGDYIKLYAELEDYTETIDGETVKKTRPTGNFLELERKAYAIA